MCKIALKKSMKSRKLELKRNLAARCAQCSGRCNHSRAFWSCPAARWARSRTTACVQTQFSSDPKVHQGVLHFLLFVFERASRWYQDHLNRSSIEKVIAVLPKSRKAVKCCLGGNLKKERRHYLVNPNLFLLL